jgi:hypothetical protein
VYSRKQDQKMLIFSLCLAQVFKKRTVIYILLSYLCVCVCVRANNLLLFFFYYSNPFFKNSTIQHITYNIVLAFCFIVYTGLFSCILFALFCVFFCATMTKKKKSYASSSSVASVFGFDYLICFSLI